MNDPIDGLLNSFTQLTPFTDASLEAEALQFLVANRAFTFAHPSRAAVAADAVKGYIQGPGREAHDVKKRKVTNMVDILLNEKTMSLANSRVLANLVKRVVQELYYCDRQLAEYCSAKIIWMGVVQMFKRLWVVSIHSLFYRLCGR